MTTQEMILERLKSLPAPAQREVLKFVDYLRGKGDVDGENEHWSRFSLTSAMDGMEDEPPLYSRSDLKESFE